MSEKAEEASEATEDASEEATQPVETTEGAAVAAAEPPAAGESSAGDAAPSAEGNGRRPWVDIAPKPNYTPSATVGGRIGDFVKVLEATLVEKEKLKLAYVDQKIHKSYFHLWVNESNKVFINIVRLNRRKAKLPPEN